MTHEYIIWGIPPQGEMETLLVSEQAGLATYDQARAACGLLAQRHGCTALRIQRLEPLDDAREIVTMFKAAVN